MSTFSVQDTQAQFVQLLHRVLSGETVLITREGVPVAQLAPVKPRGLVLGSGIGDPNYNPDAPDEWCQPMTDDEVDAFLEGRS